MYPMMFKYEYSDSEIRIQMFLRERVSPTGSDVDWCVPVSYRVLGSR